MGEQGTVSQLQASYVSAKAGLTMSYQGKRDEILRTPEDVAYLQRDDLTLQEIAKHFGICATTVHAWRKQLGEATRKKRAGRVFKKTGMIDLAARRDIILNSNSCVQAARVHGVTRQRISQLRHHALRDPAFYGLTIEQVEAARRAREEHTFPGFGR